jgi:hypothetical protein
VLDLARGADAFQARDWALARDLLRDVLSTDAPDEALEMSLHRLAVRRSWHPHSWPVPRSTPTAATSSLRGSP